MHGSMKRLGQAVSWRFGFCLLICTFCMANMENAYSQQVFPLYEGDIPNSKPNQVQEEQGVRDGVLIIGKITRPTIEVYLPEPSRSSGLAVIIFPGGGYQINAYRHEGTDVARVLQAMGVAAFVVKYRIPDSATMVNPSIGPVQDAQRAIQWVRDRAATWQIDTSRVGIMGFSAGGHLASTAGTHFNTAYIENPHGTNLRPDFMILLYPVISMVAPYMHEGSMEQLLGRESSEALRTAFSAEHNVSASTPPVFLMHTTADEVVSVLNSIRFYEALLRHQVPAEMHIYQVGKHGFGLTLPNPNEQWMERCRHWMESNGWLGRH